MAKEVKREYNVEDEVMIVGAQVNHADATDDLAAITAKVSSIDAPWLTAFLQDINNAKDYPSDDQELLNLGDFSADVEETMVDARKALSAVNGRAELAFPDDERKQRSFGQESWAKANSDHEKMRKALKLAETRCNKADINTAMLAEGMTQIEIDGLGDLADELEARNLLQEEAKGDRKVSTGTRIKLHNLVWRRRQKLATASKLVWPDDAEKQEQYQLYPPGHGDPVTKVDITIIRAGAPLADADVALVNTDLARQTTGVDGKAHFESVDMPESIEVEVHHATVGDTSETFSVIDGEPNNFTIEY